MVRLSVRSAGRSDRDRAYNVAALRRTGFPAASRRAFLNHAFDSPMPARTAALRRERIAVYQDPALEVGQREPYPALARERVARLLNVPPAQIAFATNVAEATATVANGLSWRAGDEVVLVERELASFVYPWRNLERLGVRRVFAPKVAGLTDLDRIGVAFSPRSRVVAVSEVEYQDGFRNDLAALRRLCRDRGVLLAVDASQSLGTVPTDAAAWGAGVVTAVGYKWLMAIRSGCSRRSGSRPQRPTRGRSSTA